MLEHWRRGGWCKVWDVYEIETNETFPSLFVVGATPIRKEKRDVQRYSTCGDQCIVVQ